MRHRANYSIYTETAPTERYKREMLRLMIVEANRVAKELNLDEQLPITSSNLTLVFLVPPQRLTGPWALLTRETTFIPCK